MEIRACNDLHDWDVVPVLSEPLERWLTLSLAFPSAVEANQRAELVFDGVFGHFPEGELHQNVILDVTELAISDMVREYAFLFERERKYGWPRAVSLRDGGDLASVLEERGARAFEISSAIGLAGFVLARSAEVRGAPVPA